MTPFSVEAFPASLSPVRSAAASWYRRAAVLITIVAAVAIATPAQTISPLMFKNSSNLVGSGPNATANQGTSVEVSADGSAAVVGAPNDPRAFAVISFINSNVINTPASTTTTLALSASSVAVAVPVTMTATVQAGGSPVTHGQVVFCDATAVSCINNAIFGLGQLNAAGTVSFKRIFPAGTYSIRAIFTGTTPNTTSSSTAHALTVTGNPSYPSVTTIASSGSTGNYTLTSTVTAFGKLPPSGTIGFLDTTSSNATVATATLDPTTLTNNFDHATGSPYATGNNPQGVAIGDFNGDGVPDLAVANKSDDTVSIYLGNGDGSFGTPVTYATGNAPIGLAAGDLNRDGKLDLVVANDSDATVGVLLGNGDGSFQPQVTYSVGNDPYGVAIADLNGDGFLDVVAVNNDDGDVSILLGNGDGTLQGQTTANVVGNPLIVAVGDFNGDGVPDLVVTNNSNNSVSILLGNGNGTFQPSVQYPLGNKPTGVAVGDFNGDGKLDLAVTNANDNTVSILLGNGDGTFQAQVTYATGFSPLGISVSDLNNDGKLDLIIACKFDDSACVLYGNGDGTFQPFIEYSSGDNTTFVAVGDLNGDGLLDIAAVNNGDVDVSSLLQSQTVTAVANGVAVFGSGTHNVLANFPGDSLRAASQSTTLPLTAVAPSSTTTVVTAAPNPASAGQSVTLTATVSPTPTGFSLGTASFFNGSTLLGTGNVNSSGMATFATTTLTVGASTIHAVYNGSAGYFTSTSSAITVTVTANSTTTTVAAAPNPATSGQSVTLTATVAPAPTGSSLGTVSFSSGSTLLGTGNVNSSGVATFATTTLPIGANSITAVYSGNSGFLTSTSTAVTVNINSNALTTTTTTLTVSPNPAGFGQAVTLTAMIAPPPAGSAPGTVSFFNGSTLLGTGTVSSSGVATFTTSSLAVGSLVLSAVYSGDSRFATSTSTGVTTTVTTAYAVMTSEPSVTAAQGGAVTIPLTVPPLGGTFNNVVTMSAGGLPLGATATFNPPTVTPGANGAPTTLTIQLKNSTASIPLTQPWTPRRLWPGFPGMLLGLFGVLGLAYLRAKPLNPRLRTGFAFAALFGAALFAAACNGGFNGVAITTPGSYVVTITGTSGSLTRSTTVTVVVP